MLALLIRYFYRSGWHGTPGHYIIFASIAVASMLTGNLLALCPYCIQGHAKAAMRAGASPEELVEAIWVAAEMRAGGAFAHSNIALATIEEAERALSTSDRKQPGLQRRSRMYEVPG